MHLELFLCSDDGCPPTTKICLAWAEGDSIATAQWWIQAPGDGPSVRNSLHSSNNALYTYVRYVFVPYEYSIYICIYICIQYIYMRPRDFNMKIMKNNKDWRQDTLTLILTLTLTWAPGKRRESVPPSTNMFPPATRVAVCPACLVSACVRWMTS